jgi:hypothetical protein
MYSTSSAGRCQASGQPISPGGAIVISPARSQFAAGGREVPGQQTKIRPSPGGTIENPLKTVLALKPPLANLPSDLCRSTSDFLCVSVPRWPTPSFPALPFRVFKLHKSHLPHEVSPHTTLIHPSTCLIDNSLSSRHACYRGNGELSAGSLGVSALNGREIPSQSSRALRARAITAL